MKLKLRPTTRTSLFARMSVLFGLLVTVPLVISGIVLSLVGRDAVQRNGSAVAELGEQALARTQLRLQQEVPKIFGRAASDIEEQGKKALDKTFDQVQQTAETKLAETTAKMQSQGNAAVERATGETIAVGKQTLQESLASLRASNAKSLERLAEQFSEGMDKELKGSNVSIETKLREEILKSWDVSASRRAASLVDHAEKMVDRTLISLLLPSRTSEIRSPSEDKADQIVQTLNKYLHKNRPDIVRSVVVSGNGVEYARCPGGEEEEDWANSPALAQIQKRPEWQSPVVIDGVTKKPIIRIAYRVTRSDRPEQKAGAPPVMMAPPDDEVLPVKQEPYGMIVVDLAVDGYAAEVSATRKQGPELVFIQGATGRVISASDPKLISTSIPSLVKDLPKIDEAATQKVKELPSYPTAVGNVPVRASATPWRDNVWSVVYEPEAKVQEPIEALKTGIQGAWLQALNRVKASKEGLIKERVQELARDQGKRTAGAEALMRQKQGVLTRDVTQELAQAKEKLLGGVRAELSQKVQSVRAEAGGQVASAAQLVGEEAKKKVLETAGSEQEQNQRFIQEQSDLVARRTMKEMASYSAWLVPLFLVMALFLATMTARSLVKPINRLVKATQALAAGHYDQRLAVHGEDELARLAFAFNEMAGAIERGQADLQQSHDSLADEKSRIEAIVDASPDGLVMFDSDGRVAFINPTAARLLDLQIAELPPSPFSLADLEGGTPLEECLAQARSGEGVQEYEFSEPQRRVLQLREVRLKSAQGRNYGSLLHVHDITRERVIDEMKSDFISLVSHELRTPLTSILGFSSYMLTGKLGTVVETQKMALESIHRQAKRLSAIITDFLDVSRIESGKIEMKKEPVSVPQIAARVVEDLRPQANEKSIRVEARVEEGPLPVVAMGDDQRIAQVLTNLVGNALKFTDQGSIDIVLARNNGEVYCQVKDSGCGIPPDELDRVFDRFYQVEKVVTRKSGGTGLGLAIVKNIVEAHGGRVWIESEVGKGTRVNFTLPSAD